MFGSLYKVISKKLSKLVKMKWSQPLISFLAVILSIIAIYRSCAHDKKVFDHTYKIDALSHRPLLKSPRGFILDSVQVENMNIVYPPPESLLLTAFGEPHVFDSIIGEGSFTIYGHFVLYNEGSDVAIVENIVSAATWVKKPFIRDALLKKTNKKIEWVKKPLGLYFGVMNIAPGDSFFYPLTFQINRVLDRYNVIAHVYFLYENQFGALFDTYFLFKLESSKIDNPKMFVELMRQHYKYRIGVVLSKKQMKQIFKISESDCLYMAYSKSEKANVIKKLVELRKKNNK